MSTKKQERLKKQTTSHRVVKGTGANKTILLWLSGILLITYLAFSPSLKNGFTNWDDNEYVATNSLIKSLSAENVKKMFDTDNFISYNYHPITILSLAIDYHLSGFDPKTYHLTSLLFHLANTLLVFWFIFLLSEKKITVAAIVALLFGIHTMHVESVAWIAERKDVLYVFFFMLSLIVYLKYLQQQGTQKIMWYVLLLVLFLLSILSKAMAIVLPVVLLLIDYYRGRKWDKTIILEKLPLFVLSLLFGLLAVHIQSKGAIANFAVFTFPQRICFVSYGIVNYIYSVFVPAHLSPFYPYPSLVEGHIPSVFYFMPFIVIALSAIVIYFVKKNKVLFFGAAFFIITIAMVLQFISVGKAIMADRYSYLSYVGLFFIIAMGYDWVQNNTDNRWDIYKKGVTVLLGGLFVFFFYKTYTRTKVWVNSDVLWTDAINTNPNNDEAYRNRGHYLMNKGAFDVDKKNVGPVEEERAFADFNNAIRLNPTNARDFINRANIYGTRSQFELSLKDYSKAIEIDSTNAEVFANRAVTYIKMQQYEQAIADYNKALAIDPDYLPAKQNRAYSYVVMGKYENAIVDLNELISRNASNVDYYLNRAVAYFNTGNMPAALADNTVAIGLNANSSIAYFNRSMTNKALGKYKDALDDALQAQRLGYAVPADYINELKAKAL
jgi:protein O-mannosyl-transferase